MEDQLELAVVAVERAGLLLFDLFRQIQESTEESAQVRVQADEEAEEAILDVLQSSPYPVLTEESGWVGEFTLGSPYWVVDPLDGSNNFSRGIPFCAISIGLMQDDKALLGVVYDFLRKELFTAVAGDKTYCNGKEVHVSNITSAQQGILAVGVHGIRRYTEPELLQYLKEIQRFKRVRFLGPSALSLAYLACGRIDAFISNEVMLWDIAGGIALVECAGGLVEINSVDQIPFAKQIRSACCAEVWLQ